MDVKHNPYKAGEEHKPHKFGEQLQTLSNSTGWAGKLALGFTLLPIVVWGACATNIVPEEEGISLWLGALLFALAGFVMGVVQLVRRTGKLYSALAVASGVLSPIISLVLGIATTDGGGWSRGRSLRRRGRAWTPGSGTKGSASAWLAKFESIDAPAHVADGWRINGATEVASVAAFAHLANDLLAVGAPPDLIEKAHCDAISEVRHGTLCYGIAAAIDGRSVGPQAFAAATMSHDRAPTVASVALECLRESCVLEGASARVASRLRATSRLSGAIAKVLDEIAVDEARHAEHGWEILSWCRMRNEVDDTQLLQTLENFDVGAQGVPGSDENSHRYGLASPRLWQECVAEAVRDARQRLLDGARRSA